jgi:hypothetical protein
MQTTTEDVVPRRSVGERDESGTERQLGRGKLKVEQLQRGLVSAGDRRGPFRVRRRTPTRRSCQLSPRNTR